MAKSDHMDILNSNSEFLADMKKRLKNIDTTLDIFYSNNLKDILSSLKENDSVNNLKNVTADIFYKIKDEFDINPNNIKSLFFGTVNNKFNGFLQKGDIFGLGIAMYEFLENFRKTKYANNLESKIIVKDNVKLYSLLKKMCNIDPDKRYNIIECLKHPYFL